MNILLNVALVVQIVSALALVGVILVQHGQGADMGTGFGSGASGSLVGVSGGATFLSHTTAVLATIFLTTTLVLAYFGYTAPSRPAGGSVLERAPVILQQEPGQPPATLPDAAGVPAPAGRRDAADAIPALPAQEGAARDSGAEVPAAPANAPAEPASGADAIPAE